MAYVKNDVTTVTITPLRAYWECSEMEVSRLKAKLTAVDKNKHFNPRYKEGRWDGKKTFFNEYKRECPSGLAHDAVEFLKSQGHTVRVEYADCRLPSPRPDAQINYEITADHQLRALSAMLENRRGIINAATNSGKTKIAQAWCALSDLKTLYLVPSRELLNQTVESFQRDTNLSVGRIAADKAWTIGDDVTVALVTSFSKRKNKKTNKILNQDAVAAFNAIASQFEAVIVDECHHMTATTWQWVLTRLTNAHFRFGLSGTPWEPGDYMAELEVKSQLGPVLAVVKNDELMDLGWSATPTIHMIHVDEYVSKKEGYLEAYEQGIVYSEMRNGWIVKLARLIASEGKNCLIFSTRLAQCDILFQMLKGFNVDCRLLTGQTDKAVRKDELQSFREGGFPVLISNVMSEGVDIPSLSGLTFASGGKSHKQLLQRIGRGIRKKPAGENVVEIFDFNDTSHKSLKRHTEHRLRAYEAEGFKIVFQD